ncbi:MAG: hypothetical protein EXS44_03080 [Candidatus Levybacteria bacterium]|nr:hypothetical protein [Candidatus Levybacteria bacterium]
MKIISILILFMIIFSSPVFAQNSTNSATNIPVKTEVMIERGSLRNTKNQQKEQNIKEKILLRKEILDKRELYKVAFKAKQDEFKGKLKNLKNEIKKSIVDSINTKLTTINTNQTDKMNDAIEKMNTFITKIDKTQMSMATEGKDVTLAVSAINLAKDSISSIEALVLSQTEKQYVVDIVSEEGIKASVKSSIDLLKLDIKKLHESVIDTKKLVINAGREVGKLKQLSMVEPSIAVMPENKVESEGEKQ